MTAIAKAKGRGQSALRMTLAALIMIAPIGSAAAQVRQVDPNSVLDADLDQPAPTPAPAAPALPPAPVDAPVAPATVDPAAMPAPADPTASPTAANGTTYQRDDLIGAAEGVFGRGAQGLAGIIEDILREQGEPNGYIIGREAGGALVLGIRYGSGTLHHRIEGQMPAYWTGPSIGIDAGANAGSTFVLVYNLHDTDELYHRYVAGEGAAYLVGGFNASYLRRGDVVLIPVRLGVGARLGVNAGYMKIRKKQNWIPF